MIKNIRYLTLKKSRALRTAIGAHITVFTLWGVLAYPTHAFDYKRVTGEYVDGSRIEVVSTSTTYVYPVTAPTGVSQGYSSIHRGIDIRAPKGTAVVAVAPGVVVETRREAWGYGQHVRVAHQGTMSTLYAHLDEIKIAVGDKLEAGEQIGTVGTSGWSTGSHLHLEVQEGNGTINPALILPRAI